MAENDEAYALTLFDFIEKNQVVWSGGTVSAAVKVEQGHIDLAGELFTEFAEYGSLIKRDGAYIGYYDLAIGDEVTFELAPQRNNDLFYARDLDDLLARKASLFVQPKKMVVQDLAYISFQERQEGVEPEAITAYYRLHTLLRQLEALKVLEARNEETLSLFFASGTLPVLVETDGATLAENAAGIIQSTGDMLPILEVAKYRDDKVRLLKAVLYDSWRNVHTDQRMGHFLRHSREIAKNFSNNYELFVSEFSFDSETEKLVKEQHEFSGRLSSILTSIQGRILAVPLSLILAFGQMKTSPEDDPLLINTGILAAAIVFVFLMWYLLKSQDQLLSDLKQEIDSKVARFRLTVPELFKQVEDKFASLEKQYQSTKNMLRFLQFLIVAGLIFTLFAWAYLTPQVWALLSS